jgi:hypothetical protein
LLFTRYICKSVLIKNPHTYNMHNYKMPKIIILITLFAIPKAQSQTCGLTVSNIRSPQYFNQNKPINHLDFYKFKNINRDSFALNPYTKYQAHPSACLSCRQVSTPISFVFSVNNLPFFCKLEYNMGVEKQYPLKIRLGDVQYVDQLEGKNKNGNLH